MRFLPLSVVLASLPLGVACGQEARDIETATSATDVATDVATLAPVIVTARRIAEDANAVPIGLSVIAPDTLTAIAAGGDDITYLSARTPSLIAESSFGRTFPRFYIRGLGNPDFDLNSSQPISIVYDDVPYESPVLKGFPLFDIAQVEVLRGPQGTLFGRNPPGGTIRVTSARPVLGETSADLRAADGSYDTTNAAAALNLALGDTAALRLSGLSQSRRDYIDNAATGEDDAFGGYDETALRVQFLAQPVPGLDILLNLHARRLDGEQTLFRANIFSPGSNALNANFDRTAIFQDAISEQTLDQSGLTLSIDWRRGDYTLHYVGGWESAQIGTRGDGDGGAGANFLPGGAMPGSIPFTSESGAVLDDLDQFTSELRLAHDGGGALTWQIGAFVFREDIFIKSLSFDTLAGGTQNGRADRTQETTAWAIFAAAEYDLNDRLSLSGGLRYTDDSRDFTGSRQQSPFNAPPLPPTSVSVADAQVSWDIAANYRWSDTASGYARLARGFRAPSVQGRLVFGNAISTADSETVISGEAGLRYVAPALTARGAAFYYVLNDQQLSAIGGQTNTVRLINADEGIGYGLEGEFEARPLAGLTVSGALSWTQTEIRDPGLAVPICGAPCTVLDPAGPVPRTAIIDGNPFPYAPEWIASVSAEYARPLAGGEAFAATDRAYTGERNFLLYESAEYRGEAFWEGGLRVGYRSAAGWDAALFARNILDEETALGGVDFNNLAGYTNSPRIIGIEFGLRLR